jgi:hypothetical protein
MHNNSFFKALLLLVSFLLFVSCDKEYSEIGDALIGENNFDLSKENYNVVAYNQKITPIQSDNLATNALGIYDNPAFGKTTANFATQLTLASLNPTINLALNPVIEDVYLDVPYFSTLLSTDATSGDRLYELDSIYGASTAKIKLSVFESGYLMNDLDPATGFQSPQKYFTNQNAEFDDLKDPGTTKWGRLNNDDNKAQNDEFFFDAKEHKFNTTSTTGVVTTTRTPPSMRLKLNSAFFYSKIFNAPAGKLATNDVFKEYFRGLYFKVEQSGTDPGSLGLINFAKGIITIKYKENTSSTDAARVDKIIALNLSGNTVSLLNQTNTNLAYESAVNSANSVLGDEKLYLKGGEGSLAIIELFGADSNNDGVPDELESIRNNGWLINEANLVFNIDAGAMANSYEPDRIYLYDFTNSAPVLDYLVDGSGAVKPKRAKLVFDGNINRDPASLEKPKRGLTYKIRITNHIRNLINNKDTKNVKLGLVVTEDIAIANFSFLRTPIVTPAFSMNVAPRASVMNPLGTILEGGKLTVPDAKRLKLEIYYTKPN